MCRHAVVALPLALPLALLALSGCDDTVFAPRWRVERFRVLGVELDPPDALPGETVTATLVYGDRAGSDRTPVVAWQRCGSAAMDNATGARLCGDTGGVTLGNPARITLPTAPAGGAPWTLFGYACAGGAPSVDPVTGAPRCDGGEGEMLLRTIRVRGDGPNHNPRITRVRVGDVEAVEGTSLHVPGCAIVGDDARHDGCRGHVITVDFADDAREAVATVRADGSRAMEREALVTEFLVDAGDLEGAFRSDNDAEGGAIVHRNTWRAPTTGPVRLWVLVRDGRGGFGVARRALIAD